MYFILEQVDFHCYVSLPEGCLKLWFLAHENHDGPFASEKDLQETNCFGKMFNFFFSSSFAAFRRSWVLDEGTSYLCKCSGVLQKWLHMFESLVFGGWKFEGLQLNYHGLAGNSPFPIGNPYIDEIHGKIQHSQLCCQSSGVYRFMFKS